MQQIYDVYRNDEGAHGPGKPDAWWGKENLDIP